MQTLKEAFDSADLSSRAKRRKATALVAGLLARIRAAEAVYLARIPYNLQSSDACYDAENSVSILDEAIDTLNAAYD